MRLSRLSLAAHGSDYPDAADALNRACDQLGLALDLLGPNRRRKTEQESGHGPSLAPTNPERMDTLAQQAPDSPESR